MGIITSFRSFALKKICSSTSIIVQDCNSMRITIISQFFFFPFFENINPPNWNLQPALYFDISTPSGVLHGLLTDLLKSFSHKLWDKHALFPCHNSWCMIIEQMHYLWSWKSRFCVPFTCNFVSKFWDSSCTILWVWSWRLSRFEHEKIYLRCKRS